MASKVDSDNCICELEKNLETGEFAEQKRHFLWIFDFLIAAGRLFNIIGISKQALFCFKPMA